MAHEPGSQRQVSSGTVRPSDDERPDLYAENPDPRVWSNRGRSTLGADGEYVTVRLTWAEVAVELDERLRGAEEYKRILFDLDRCEHGRHEGDVCGGTSGCNGPSLGNPLFRVNGHPPLAQHERRQLGFNISRQPIVYPERSSGYDPENWEPKPGSGDSRGPGGEA